ncbi:hypothetical protein [Furfurilactobacillus curtus]|uniref:Lipoprotein n=1 Tax=Furfurilactobacillus curtus TaxID=1746200 RepID=A0ABQ5JKF7_9LACO
MLKKIVAAVVVLASMVILTACGQKSYGGVQVTQKEYTRVQNENKRIEALVTALQKFRYDNEASANKVYQAADQVNQTLRPGLSEGQKNQLANTLGDGPTGVKGIVKAAVNKQYNFDDEVASQFHANFRLIFDMAAYTIGNSAQQRSKIETQMRKDTNADTELYKIGSQE